MLYVGVDPGMKGAIAVLNDTKELVLHWDMPYNKETGYISSQWLSELINFERFKPQSGISVWLEDVHSMPHQGVKSMFTFGYVTGQVVGMINQRGINLYRVTPQKWRNTILGKVAVGMGKVASIEHAQQYYSNPKDGLADAICIAEYGWKVNNENVLHK